MYASLRIQTFPILVWATCWLLNSEYIEDMRETKPFLCKLAPWNFISTFHHRLLSVCFYYYIVIITCNNEIQGKTKWPIPLEYIKLIRTPASKISYTSLLHINISSTQMKHITTSLKWLTSHVVKLQF